MGKYTVNEGFVVLDENSNIVDWFDTEDEALDFAGSLENNQ